jgi:hypothetical protein
MTLSQLMIQTALTFIAASLGAIFAAFLTRRTEKFKHLQELRSAAYADFLRGFARAGRAQNDSSRSERSINEELEGRVLVTDSRSRIVIYGERRCCVLCPSSLRLELKRLRPRECMRSLTYAGL